ncbi:RHS repeat-associated core domain-containing protein [Luteimonas sp. A277]
MWHHFREITSDAFSGPRPHRLDGVRSGQLRYDVLDNLATVNVSGGSQARNHTYVYDMATRHLSQVTNTVGGAVVANLTYDVQGNLAGKGAQTYQFDLGNRLRSVPGQEAGYEYDGHGRRVFAQTVGSGQVLSQYGNDGRLLYQEDQRHGRRTDYVYLGSRLVAYRERPLATSTVTVKYQHADALGTPIAVTNAAKATIETGEYEPYGRLVNKPLFDGPGYTGHVQDAATGLTYMQQRYYDPQLGVFLSVDPVTAYSSPVSQSHRYRYANNNPYKFKDPDGRAGCAASRIQATCASYGMGPTDAIEAGWSVERRTKAADAIISRTERQFESRKDGNRFDSFDDAAKYFRSRFAKVGAFLRLEFGAVSEPIVHNIVGITRSQFPTDFIGMVGVAPSLGPTPLGGADFHTHPAIWHPRPGFSGGDLQSAMWGNGRYSYVFYGYTTYAGKRLDVMSAKRDGVSPMSSDIYDYITDVP